MRPGYTQTDDFHAELGWGGANVGFQHLRRIPKCSEVPDTCFFWHILGFLGVLGRNVRSARGQRILPRTLQKLLGIYPVPTREISQHGWFS